MTWRGRVVDATYRSNHRSILVNTECGRLHAEAPPLQRLAVGDQAAFLATPEGAWALRP